MQLSPAQLQALEEVARHRVRAPTTTARREVIALGLVTTITNGQGQPLLVLTDRGRALLADQA